MMRFDEESKRGRFYMFTRPNTHETLYLNIDHIVKIEAHYSQREKCTTYELFTSNGHAIDVMDDVLNIITQF